MSKTKQPNHLPSSQALVAVPAVSALVWVLAAVAVVAIGYGALSGMAGRPGGKAKQR